MRIALSVAPEKLPAGLSETFLRSLIRETSLRAFPAVFEKKGRGVRMEVAFVSDAKIAALNHAYRGKNRPTDVLSFGEFSSPDEVKKSEADMLELGSLILSVPFIKRSAKEDGVSWKKEFVFVFSHGVLHLLGHDHGEAMFAIQDAVTDTFSQS